MENLNKWK